jgi:hypothetical protein
MKLVVTALLVLTLAVVACGGDSGGNNNGIDNVNFNSNVPIERELPDEADDLAGLVESAPCAGSSLGAFEATGLWYVIRENPRFFSGPGGVRFAVNIMNIFEVLGSLGTGNHTWEFHSLTDDYFLWRTKLSFDDFDLYDALALCVNNGDGTYGGVYRRCFDIAGEVDCDDDAFTLIPHGRKEGEVEAKGLELISEFHGPANNPWPASFAANVRVKNDIAYFVHNADGIRIIDISSKEAPVELGFYPSDGQWLNDVKLVEDGNGKQFALIAADPQGALALDVSDPTRPTLAATFTPSGEADHGVHTLFVETIDATTYAYLADGFSKTLAIYDVTNPAAPSLYGRFDANEDNHAFHDLYVSPEGRVFANGTLGGMYIFDTAGVPTSQPALGVFQGGDYSHSNWVTSAGGRTISIHGGEGFDAHAQIVDVDPASPDFLTVIGEYQTRPQVSIHNIMAAGEKAYIAHYADGVRIVDLSDPANPVEEAYFNSWNPDASNGGRFEGVGGIDLDLGNGYIYAADSSRGLLILKILEQ